MDITGDNEEKNTVSDEVRHWLNEIAASSRREKDFRKEGDRIIEIYEGGKSGVNGITVRPPFNILFSNTETMLPSVYSMVPRPVVQRRFKDEDKVGKSAAVAGQRLLEFLLDTNIEGYETFDDAMKLAVLAGLLPGRGVTAVKYEAEVVDVEDEVEEGAEPLGEEAGEPTPYMQSELVCTQSIEWDRVRFGYAKKWSKVPWVSYETHMDKEECEKLFGAEMTAKIEFSKGEEREENDDFRDQDDQEQNIGERKTALIYQIWDKDGGRKIRYVSPHMTDGYLLVEDDPLGLTGFFNCPKPVQFVQKLSDMVPTPMYALYEQQATELNNLSRRIINVIDAIKAKGIYDSALGDDIQNILMACENELVPADKGSSLAAEKGMQNAIWFWPVEKLIVVLQQLYQAREACKQVIYEITGIADIMRGSSNASETLGAQEIKQQWGTLRLKRLQKEVQRYARELLRMMLEVGAQKFSVETWSKMTGLPFVTAEQRDQAMKIQTAMQVQAQQVMQQYQMQAQAAQAQGMQPPPPPQPPQPDPQVQFALDAPVWEEVLAVLKDDIQRSYRIDIETNTTIEAEAAEDQKNIAEVMNALAQYLNGVTPLVIKGALPFEAAQGMMLAIIRRFRFGPEIEDYIKQMKAPQPEGDGGKAAADQAKLQADQQKLQADTQAAHDKLASELQSNLTEIDKQKNDAKAELEREWTKLQMEKMEFDFQQKLAEQQRAANAEIDRIRQEAAQATASSEMTAQLTAHKQAVQSMLDKHAAKIDMQKVERQEQTKEKVALVGALAQERAAEKSASRKEGE